MILITQIRDKARRDLHRQMRVPALFYEYGEPDNDPIRCWPRVHYKFDALGDAKGTNFHYAEREEVVPRILFMNDDPVAGLARRNCVLMTGLDTGYRLDHDLPPDGITTSWRVLKLEAPDAHAFAYPGDDQWPISTWSP